MKKTSTPFLLSLIHIWTHFISAFRCKVCWIKHLNVMQKRGAKNFGHRIFLFYNTSVSYTHLDVYKRQAVCSP